MIHAFILTAYRDPKSLKTLIRQLVAINGSQIYCCIDHKSKQMAQEIHEWVSEQVQSDPRYDQIEVLNDQVIRYASTDHLKVQLDLIRQALLSGADYCHTLTGQCRLVVSPEQFTAFFNAHEGQNFIEHFSLPAKHWSGDGGLSRIQYFQLYDVMDIKKWRGIFDISNRTLLLCQRLLKIDRRKSYPINSDQFWGGLGYWSLHKDALSAILAHPILQSNNTNPIYKNSHCAEEFVLHTALMNSAYGKAHKHKIIPNHLRFMDWGIGHGESPAILDEKHLNQIEQGAKNEYPYLFARKFDSRFSENLEKHLQKLM
jgi:hypothetical protein